MKVLIAGGAGFIGSHLCDRLLSDGHEVICVDNLITGSKKNIKHNLANSRFSFIEFDVAEGILQLDGNLDYIVNLASPASPVDYQKYPIETLKVGALGTLNTLELARRKKAKYLFSSTSEVYGDPDVSPQAETYWGRVNPVGSRSQYDESKRFAEALIVAYRKKHSLDAKIVRIFNTYGPRMRKNDGRVVPNFICQALTGKPLTIYGDGAQTRSFCYIDDLVEGIVKMMFAKEAGPINLGNQDEFTIRELANKISKIINRKLSVTKQKLPPDDPKQRCPDITLAKRHLKWQPKIKLQEGLVKTIEWFKEIR
ncbi:MAG: SDR family oxidoreductase [Candidatus Margulisbacteria bacterium]|nr:SDR family oxidoreductase [Candidatus Margulisiibacteriota bacterium]MBU1021505.1 SDR family oxidoreductase [Candidatus Margulisiibacteriota bacterium]MBU1728590.1 SDR family oxidoreductase [Candidatus Margulisiibacteriota bacterium]MBU1955831.1 SDR family oxidoreductase [Candidatus Margulisiibacteriota bacterium]